MARNRCHIHNLYWFSASGTPPLDPCETFDLTITDTDYSPVVESCVEYGYLYNWYAATDVRKISSSDDWYVPAHTDFDSLMLYLDPDGTRTANDAGQYLKESGTTYWIAGNTGTNDYGFNGRGAAARVYTGAFVDGGVGGNLPGARQYFHTSTNFSGIDSWYITLDASNDVLGISAIVNGEKRGYSVRLIKDATGIPDGTTTVYIGNDGKTYSAIAINGLYWTQYNLAETQYRNGDPIPTVEDNTTWAGLTTGAKCAYDNDYANVGCDETG